MRVMKLLQKGVSAVTAASLCALAGGGVVPVFAGSGTSDHVADVVITGLASGSSSTVLAAPPAGTGYYLRRLHMQVLTEATSAGWSLSAGSFGTLMTGVAQDAASAMVSMDFECLYVGPADAITVSPSGATATQSFRISLTYDSTATSCADNIDTSVTTLPVQIQSGSSAVPVSESGAWSVAQSGAWTVTVGNSSLPVTCASGGACHVTVDNASLPVTCASSGQACHVTVDGGSIAATQAGTWSMGQSGSWTVTVGNSSLPITCSTGNCHVTIDNPSIATTCASGGSCHSTIDNASLATTCTAASCTMTVGNTSLPITCAAGGSCHATVDNASLPVACTASSCTMTVGNSSLPVTCAQGGACHVTVDGQAITVACSAGCEGTPGSPQSVDVASYGNGSIDASQAAVSQQWVVLVVGVVLVMVCAAQLFVSTFRR